MAALLGANIIKVKLPTAFLENKEAKKVYEEKKIPIATLAERVKHVMQCCFNGRRIVVFSGGAAKGERQRPRRRARDPRRRRQRLDHRPQLLPAPARRSDEAARRYGRNL